MPVTIEKNTPVFTVVIDRPEVKNAVDGPTAVALANAFRQFEVDEDMAIAVLCGAGGTFCAGADLKAFAGNDKSRANRINPEGDGPMGPSRMLLNKPVIAAIAGHAVAGGMELASWCDLRVMEETAQMGVFCRRFGVPLIDGGTVRLPRLIGMSHALDLILTGRPVEACEAKSMGLAHRVVPHGEARQAARSWPGKLLPFLKPVCEMIASVPMSSGSFLWRMRWLMSFNTGCFHSTKGKVTAAHWHFQKEPANMADLNSLARYWLHHSFVNTPSNSTCGVWGN